LKNNSTKKKPKRKPLVFNYCECGCHGFSVTVGTLSFWAYLNLKTKKWSLHQGHGHSARMLREHGTLKEITQTANKIINKTLGEFYA